MLNTIVGTKSKMGSAYIEGVRIPVTKIASGPCIVTQVKSADKNGYWAVQLGFGSKKIKSLTKPQLGHLKGAYQKSAPRFLFEVKLSGKTDLKVGDVVTPDAVFKKGDKIAVTGTSKGKGFAGGVKRWHFRGGPKTHGQSDRHRAPGSIGQGTTPGRVYKGKKMAGRMGGETKTIKNLIIVDIDKEKGELLVSGAVPGSTGGFIKLRRISAGKLDELIHETPHAEVQQEESEGEAKKEVEENK